MPGRHEQRSPRAPDEPGPPEVDAEAGDRSPENTLTPASPRRGTGRETEQESLRLTELLREDLVKLPVLSDDMWGAIEELVALMVVAGDLPKGLAEAAMKSVREREAIRSTGWKNGLAFPTGRVAGLRRIAAAVGVSLSGVDFGCRDGLPAKIIVLIFFPVGRYSRFAHGIEGMARTFDDPLLRETILAARKPDEVVEAIEDAEAWELG